MAPTPHSFEGWPSARAPAILHRNAITAADKILQDTQSVTDLATGGSLAFNTLYYISVAGGNRWGDGLRSSASSITTANDSNNTHSIRVTIPQLAGATHYEIFLSIDVLPLYVGRVTEAQRAAGDYQITAMGVVSTGGGNPAGTIDVDVVGTGLSVINPMWSSADGCGFRPDTITPIVGQGFSEAHALVKLSLTDLRSAPTLQVIPFFRNSVSPDDWHQGIITNLAPLTALGTSLERDVDFALDGANEFVVLIAAISGQGAAVSIWVERA